MMIANRRRQYSQSANNYIKEGLVFWLDGSDATTTKWIDRVGGLEFAMQDVTLVDNGGVMFNGNSSKGISEVSYNAHITKSTIELVFRANNVHAQQIIIGSHVESNIIAGIDRSTLLIGNYYLWSMSGATIMSDKDITISVNQTSKKIHGFLNKDVITTNIADYFTMTDGNYITLGCRTRTGVLYFKGILYSIRIYNRHLSDDEMLHNQSIDIQRYNIAI